MGFDPSQEEYRRLGLRYVRTQGVSDTFTAARAASAFRRRFEWNHDSLPQTDQDRAFHLVVRASEIIDYDLPFADEKDAPALLWEARSLLDEAVKLDSGCVDAERMIAMQESPSFESFYRYLLDKKDEVRAVCFERRDQILAASEPGAKYEAELVLYPYYRWLFSLSYRAFLVGRYKKSVEFARELLGLNPDDVADVRFVAYLALAKLEDAQGLEELIQAYATKRSKADAWQLLAQAALAFKQIDGQKTTDKLAELLENYPGAAPILMAQGELPEGVFARVNVEPFSNDELVIAVSEAIVLLQEGVDLEGRGSFGAFVAKNKLVVGAYLYEQAHGQEGLFEDDGEGAPEDDGSDGAPDDGSDDEPQDDAPASDVPDGGVRDDS